MNVEAQTPRKRLRLAILMVNGRHNYRDRLWIELSLDALVRRTSPHTPYRIFLWNHDRDNPRIGDYLRIVRDHVEVVDEATFDVNSWDGWRHPEPPIKADYFAGGRHVHRGALQMLYEYASARYEIDFVFTFDSDAWPVRDNWEIPLLHRLERDIHLVGVWRDELRAVISPYVHASGLGVRTTTLNELELRFDREPKPPREDTLSHLTRAIEDRFGPDAILRLERSNRFQYHSVFNGVYGDRIYHHHLGTRYRDGRAMEPRTGGWRERGESLSANKFALDATTAMVFADRDAFCCELQYGERALALKPYIHLLRSQPLPGAARRLREAAAQASDPEEAHFLIGLVGRHYAMDPGFLKLAAQICDRTDRGNEATALRELSENVPADRATSALSDPVCPGPHAAKAQESLGLERKVGERHYRAFVGPPREYDLIAAMAFNLLTNLGLRQHHSVADIGCGSLRVGRLLIPYLNADNYLGLEPNRWLVHEGIEREVGRDLVRVKRPTFVYSADPEALPEDRRFDFAVAQSVFSHATLELIERYLRALRLRLAPSGALAATFKAGERDFFHPDGISARDFQADGWIYPKCPTYRVETIRDLALRCGLRFELLDWAHPRQTWALIAREDFDSSWFKGKPPSWNLLLKRIVEGRSRA